MSLTSMVSRLRNCGISRICIARYWTTRIWSGSVIWSHESSECKRRGIWPAVGLCCALGYERTRDSQSDSGHDFSLWLDRAAPRRFCGGGSFFGGAAPFLWVSGSRGKPCPWGGGGCAEWGGVLRLLVGAGGGWPGLLHSILSLILAVLTGVMLFGVRRQDFSSIRLPLAPFFCIGGVTAYWLAAAAAVI